MIQVSQPKHQTLLEILLSAILFTFFLQLLSDFIASIYAFGLLGTSMPIEILAVLLFFSPVLLLFARRDLADWVLLASGELMLASRMVEVLLETRGRMLVSGIGVACFLVFFPSLLWRLGRENRKYAGGMLGWGLTLALVTSILFKALYSGIDVSTSHQFQFIGWILAAIAAIILDLVVRSGRSQERVGLPIPDVKHRKSVSFAKVTGLSSGITAVFLLLYYAFASPNVIARWTGANYMLILSALLLSICLFAALLLTPWFRVKLTPTVIWGWNIVYVASMALTILAHQILFPADPGAYPLYEPPLSILFYVPLLIMVALSPVILIDFVLYVNEIIRIRPAVRALGGGFALSSLFLLIMVFAHVFTTVYDYIPVIGPLLRDKFWLVHLVVGIVLAFPLLLVSDDTYNRAIERGTSRIRKVVLGYLILASIVSVVAAFLVASQPTPQPGEVPALKVLTYNIQQGYSEDGLENYDGQLQLIRSLDPDIIGLQESDTNRISGANKDIVRFFADNLNMYSYYGPKTVLGTFGIALLSKYSIEQPRTFYMYSAGEQTATIHAQITAEETYNVYVTHLGNEGPIVQQEALLKVANAEDNVIMIGDFNFKPDTPQYRMTVEKLNDSWLLKWPSGVDDQGLDPVDRIDHMFISPGTAITDARYIFSPVSDHPAFYVVIEP
jgi:endonuclease/exonuclease/phosphatase family metal-dependent hydrolase